MSAALKYVIIIIWDAYMIRDVTDDFNVARVFIPGRDSPLYWPVVAVIHLQRGHTFQYLIILKNWGALFA